MNGVRKGCLTTEEILAYLGNETGPARSGIERHLDECRLCAAAVEGVAGLDDREAFAASADRVRARIRERTARATAAARERRPRAWLRPSTSDRKSVV